MGHSDDTGPVRQGPSEGGELRVASLGGCEHGSFWGAHAGATGPGRGPVHLSRGVSRPVCSTSCFRMPPPLSFTQESDRVRREAPSQREPVWVLAAGLRPGLGR